MMDRSDETSWSIQVAEMFTWNSTHTSEGATDKGRFLTVILMTLPPLTYSAIGVKDSSWSIVGSKNRKLNRIIRSWHCNPLPQLVTVRAASPGSNIWSSSLICPTSPKSDEMLAECVCVHATIASTIGQQSGQIPLWLHPWSEIPTSIEPPSGFAAQI